jgi:catechol 2,3-dioxygenase-like lactoylglutathione lyase family enzyme
MLKVPNVDETVKFWTSRGGTVRISRPITTDPPDNEHDEEVDKAPPLLKSAFVEMGCSSTSSSGSTSMSPPPTFALELVRTDANKGSSSKSDNSIRKEEPRYRLGNEIRYIGISKLLLFQNNLLGVITGDATKKEKGGMGGSDSGGDGEVKEPNGIDVQFSASAPGDFFARFCLRSNDLPATSTFYSTVLGMDIKAQDDQMLCLRYDNINFPSSTYGVATTLVFDASDKTTPIEKGDCLDHIAITTSSSVDELYNRITISAMTTQSSQQSRQVDETTTTTSGDSNNVTADDKDSNNDVKIFMKPTEMFGRRVMGLIDPNGYKVVVAGN